MRTIKPHPIGVRKRLCVSVLGGKRSIYFLLNIGYVKDCWSPLENTHDIKSSKKNWREKFKPLAGYVFDLFQKNLRKSSKICFF